MPQIDLTADEALALYAAVLSTQAVSKEGTASELDTSRDKLAAALGLPPELGAVLVRLGKRVSGRFPKARDPAAISRTPDPGPRAA